MVLEDKKEKQDIATDLGKQYASMVKIVNKDNYIVGTGYIISQGLIVTSTEVIGSKDKIEDNKKVYYYNPNKGTYSKCEIEENGVYCANSDLGLVVLSVVDRKTRDKTPLPEDVAHHLKATDIGEKGILVRASRGMTKIKPTRELQITDVEEDKFTLKAVVDESSAGSIVLDDEANLLGFIAKPRGQESNCVTMAAFLKWIAVNLDNIAPHLLDYELPKPKEDTPRDDRRPSLAADASVVLDFRSYAMRLLKNSSLVIYQPE